MDLLRGAYANGSDEDEDELPPQSPPPPKRLRREPPRWPPPSQRRNGLLLECPSGSPSDRVQEAPAPVPGRYVSKRERAVSSAAAPTSAPHSSSPSSSILASSPVTGSISRSDLPSHILSSLNGQTNGGFKLRGIPEKMSILLKGHTKAVNAIHWSPTHAHLLASAGMDQTVCVWNVWKGDQPKARVLNYHSAAVKDVKWSPQGLSLLSCGYDCSTRLVDVEKGTLTKTFKEDQVVCSLRFHPNNCNLFLSGGLKGSLRLWDIRADKIIHEYIRDLGPILDIEFSGDGKQFISSSDVSGSNLSENAIIVWDVRRQVPLSNQVYVEAYTCPCIRYHPIDSCFVAQSNGNYIAIFSSRPPFKLNQYMRYEKHGVSGFPIKCNFSLDGEMLASGSSDGRIYFYSYSSSNLLRTINAYEQACIDVAFHPIFPNVIASCSWGGDVAVCE